MEKAPWPI